MATLFDFIVKASRRLPGILAGKATGGTTTTLVDSARLTAYPDDAWARGWLLFTSGEECGNVVAITGSDESAGTVTFATLSTGPSAGDSYVILPGIWDPYVISAGISEGIDVMGKTEALDETLSGDGDTRTFTLPDAVAAGEIRRVFMVPTISSSRNDAAVELLHWEQRGDGTLWFSDAPQNNSSLRLIYVVSNAIDTTDFTEAMPSVGESFVIWHGVKAAAGNVVGRPGYDQDRAVQIMNLALELIEQERLNIKPPRAGRELYGGIT